MNNVPPQWRMQDFRKGGSSRREPHPLFVSHAHARARTSNWLMTRSCAHVIGAVNASADRLSVTYTIARAPITRKTTTKPRNYVIPCQKGGSIAPLDPPLDPPLPLKCSWLADSLVLRPRGGRGRGYSSQRYDVNSNH